MIRSLALSLVALVMPNPSPTPTEDFQRAHRAAVRYHHQRDALQAKLTRRVLEVRRLRRQLLVLHRRFRAAPSRPPHYAEWLCLYRYESGGGGWSTNTGNGYYGGLQFAQSTWDRNGGRRYAARADLATSTEQMWVAESAWRESGGSFSQWPLTSRMCGLR